MHNLYFNRKIKAVGYLIIFITVSWFIVYFSNGTSSVFPLLFFIPITFAAWKLGAFGGLTVGLLSGIVIGPFMALDVSQQIAQPLYNWVMRLLFFSVYGYAIGRLITELKSNSIYDSLMGIPNRTFFYRYLTTKLQQKKIKKAFFVVLINIDDFKSINDSIGHTAADSLLIEIKSRILNCISKKDMLARWSGDEFAIVVFGDSEEQLTPVCDCIYKTLRSPFEVKGQQFFINASMGASAISSKHQKYEILLKEAETAMRFVKKRGKNCYKFYTEEMDRNSLEEKLLETKLHQALEEEQFELYYQAKIDCKEKKIYGVEALVRWNSPEEGIISPGVFIPMAEKTGLIIPIGNWVLKTACNQVKKWQEQNLRDICISVNVSALQIQEEDFVSTVANILEETNINPELIELEITESSIMEDTIENIMKLNELKELGLKISLDDFGKGYSSLNYLKILPIDTLKVDKSFIQNIEYDPKEKVITESIIRMAKALGLKVLAEGIENESQHSLLVQLDCDAMQGFLFSKPLPIEQAENLIKKNRSVIYER